MSVAVIGSLSLDSIDGTAPRIGGGPYYCGRALRALAVPAVIVAKRCARPPAAAATLIRLGVPVVWQDSTVSAAFPFSYENERRRMTVEAFDE
jgi:hypothetical protein